MRVRIKGVNKVRKKLADGTHRTHYYLGRGKGALKLDGTPGSPEFMASYERAVKATPPQRDAVLQGIIHKYLGSPEFQMLAPRTQRDYSRQIGAIERKFGDLPLAALTDPRMRGEFKDWRNRIAERSARQADYAWTVLALILKWAKDDGRIPVNPCEKGGRLYQTGARRESVWTDEDEVAFMAAAAPELALALQLALWTGQRQGDLLRLTWSQYDGETIRLTQGKGGVRLAIPVAGPLRTLLSNTQRRAVQVLTNRRGVPWTEHGFRSSWRKVTERVALQGLTFHDLRGTAVTRLALAGCTQPQIVAFTGHSLKAVGEILDRFYLHRDPELARQALEKLEARTNSANRAANRSGVLKTRPRKGPA